MGLIKCPDCSKMFSDRIKACPKCGCPIEEAVKEQNVVQKEFVGEMVESQGLCGCAVETQEEKNEKTVSEKMSSTELVEFAMRSIIPEMKKELGCNSLQLFRVEEIEYPGVLMKTESGSVWLDVLVEVAPIFKSSIVNWENVKKAEAKGWKYAVAHIGVGARDEARFERRVVLKNDAYYVRYEGLKYFEYPKNSNVRFSLSEDNYEYIYKRETPNNPFVIVREVEDYRKTYDAVELQSTIEVCWNKYELPVETKKYLTGYFKEIGEAICYSISLKDVILNFWYCFDCCKGLLFSDSVPLRKSEFIPKCYEILSNNTLIKLSRYDVYLFSFLVYYYLTSGEHQGEIESGGYLNREKIKLFEKRPGYFGLDQIAENKRKAARKNSSENVFNMYLKLNHYLENDFAVYQLINVEANAESKKKLIDFNSILNRFKELLATAEKNYHYLVCNFDKNKSFKGREIYLQFYEVSLEYRELLKKDCRIFEKMLSKSKGGKYGFFDYRRDSKQRDEQLNKVINLTERIRKNFHMPIPSKETKIMVSICSIFFDELKEKYLKEVKNNPNLYGDFRNELCRYYDNALLTPYDKAFSAEREFFILNITDFIELIEWKEEDSEDEDVIYDREEKIFNDMEVIRENTYRMLVM